jgi:hypothetical protein
MNLFEAVNELQKGKSVKQLEKELREVDLKKAKEPDKMFGTCDACQNETVLMKETGMCGPCSTGEADTANGNW